jgi:hypothetical protein
MHFGEFSIKSPAPLLMTNDGRVHCCGTFVRIGIPHALWPTSSASWRR